ncbi:MAG: ribonuclease E/G [Lachnospiraceae bacterium]|nr:ribonuclease E/G [Lachnospiraceae bacterium]
MSSTLVYTRSEKYNKDVFLSLYDGHASEIIVPGGDEVLLGDIYVGLVKNVVKNINAAFIEVKDGVPCYYEMDKNKAPVFLLQHSEGRICQGDLVLVQVTKEAHKTKQPCVSGDISISSKYAVLTAGNTRISMSSKLGEEERSRLNEIAKGYKNDEFGLIFRTNAGSAPKEEIISQIDDLIREYEDIRKRAAHNSAFALIKRGEPDYIRSILGQYDSADVQKIVTDNREVYQVMLDYVRENRPEYEDLLEFYQDPMVSLCRFHNIDAELDKAVSEKVWLKSGAYLVIEPTEAMTVIDVNSGKYDGKKKSDETYLKINLEAAEEVARQLRLRNISGICMIDFIDMASPMDKKQLVQKLSEFTAKDPVKTVVVDITKLGLVEITRKRMKKSLAEQLFE